MPFNKDKPSRTTQSILGAKRSVFHEHDCFKISFKHFDTSQKFGSGFKDWQKAGLLARALETLSGYCQRPLLEQIDGTKFAKYDTFPKKGYTEFVHPSKVPEDATWARLHIGGKEIIAGHIVTDTFYIVFLDKSHAFYITKRNRKKKDNNK